MHDGKGRKLKGSGLLLSPISRANVRLWFDSFSTVPVNQ